MTRWIIVLLASYVCMAGSVTTEQQKTIIDNIAEHLQQRYVFEEKGIEAGDHIKALYRKGAYKTILDQGAFASKLTEDLQSITHDKHMRVGFTQARSAEVTPNPVLINIERRVRNAEHNQGFKSVKVLDGNIGYLELTGFSSVDHMRAYADSTMQLLANVDAFILDLRYNRGGDPRAVRYLSSYFMEPGIHLNSIYSRDTGETEEFWTLEKIAGKRRVDLPLFVLISDETFSAGEECANNFRELKRATLIGQVTGGGANPGGRMPVSHGFHVFVPTGRAINPISGTNWEGVGVKPHIETPVEKALEVALEKAQAIAKQRRESARDAVGGFVDALSRTIKASADMSEAGAMKHIQDHLAEGLKAGFLDEDTLNLMGYQAMRSKSWIEAEAMMRANVDGFPESANVYDSLAEVLLARGKRREAVASYEQAVAIARKTNEANLELFEANLERAKAD